MCESFKILKEVFFIKRKLGNEFYIGWGIQALGQVLRMFTQTSEFIYGGLIIIGGVLIVIGAFRAAKWREVK